LPLNGHGNGPIIFNDENAGPLGQTVDVAHGCASLGPVASGPTDLNT
jgi:hypothetical protein